MLRHDDAIVLRECHGWRSSDERLHSECIEGGRKREEMRNRKRFGIEIRIMTLKAKKTSRSWI